MLALSARRLLCWAGALQGRWGDSRSDRIGLPCRPWLCATLQRINTDRPYTTAVPESPRARHIGAGTLTVTRRRSRSYLPSILRAAIKERLQTPHLQPGPGFPVHAGTEACHALWRQAWRMPADFSPGAAPPLNRQTRPSHHILGQATCRPARTDVRSAYWD